MSTVLSAAATTAATHVDVLIVGAGISGIGSAEEILRYMGEVIAENGSGASSFPFPCLRNPAITLPIPGEPLG